jgi:hypothetical protein
VISGVCTKEWGVFKFGSYTLDEDKISLYIQHTEDLTDPNSNITALGTVKLIIFPSQNRHTENNT